MSRRDDEAPETGHVFDQTNGVLGADDEPEARPRAGSQEPPSSFGVPPIVSL